MQFFFFLTNWFVKIVVNSQNKIQPKMLKYNWNKTIFMQKKTKPNKEY